MSAGEPFLGALDGSRRVFAKERAKNAPGTAHCTEKSLKFSDRTKHSRWQLAGVQAAAFSGANRSAKTGQFHLRTAMFLALTVYDRRAHPSGQAVCLLGLRKGRFILLVAGLVLLIATAGLLSPYAGSALAALVLAVLMPGVVGAFRAARCEQPAKEVNSIRPIRLRSLVGQHVAGSRSRTITRAHQRERSRMDAHSRSMPATRNWQRTTPGSALSLKAMQ